LTKDQVELAKHAALRGLARADKSAAALQRALERRFDPDSVARALAALTAEGWLDEAAGASRLARRLAEEQLLAAAAIRERLCARGYPERLIDATIDEIKIDETMAMRRLAERIGLDPERPQRLAGRLRRAGYDPSAVADLLRQLLARG